jgi:hypothetical protein
MSLTLISDQREYCLVDRRREDTKIIGIVVFLSFLLSVHLQFVLRKTCLHIILENKNKFTHEL